MHRPPLIEKVRSTSGFTILELIIVIAVIGVLCVLLSVALGRAQAQLKNTRSISNLRHLGVVLNSYANDHQGKMPQRIETIENPNGTTSSGLSWHAQLSIKGYIPNRNILFNPKEKHPTWEAFLADPTVSITLKRETAAWLPVYGYRLSPIEPPARSNIQAPSKYFLIVESWSLVTNGPGYFVSPDPMWRVKIGRNGTANTLFADGHVEAKSGDFFTNHHLSPTEETGGGRYHVWGWSEEGN